MKKMYLFALLALVSPVLFSCGNDGADSNERDPVEITNREGTVYFNSTLQKWYISVPKPGTYDVVENFFPTNLNETYQTENIKVRFSGRTFDSIPAEELIGVPAGTTYIYIELSSIKLL